MYKKLIKPVLFLMSPDFVHRATVFMGKIAQSIPLVRWIIKKWWRYDNSTLEQNLFGINFINPVGLSAGFDKNVELTPLMESVGFGFETGGSVTLAKRTGNKRPWFYRLPKSESIVVHAGLANKGIVNIGRKVKRNLKRVKQTPLIISVAVVAKTQKETCEDAIIDAKNTMEYILQHQLAQMIEINISCPNAGDSQPFSEPEMLDKLLTKLDEVDRDVPVFVKMPNFPKLSLLDSLLKVIIQHNVQGVTIANLVKGRQKIKLSDDLPDDIKGGLSGAPTRYRSTMLIRYTYRKYGNRLKIIGVGGIFNAEQAYEKIKAGASMVGMITGVIFEGPQVVGRVNRELVEMLKNDGYHNISEAIGAWHRE
ncbi:quinone-dependent dihydroorotate dehydrogenase [Candidatus Saccharibacteria bacterium]|nr:quinone-dependent dihydroorotate dehydrogenase [Candidatus Saccharibacteria bacterium]